MESELVIPGMSASSVAGALGYASDESHTLVPLCLEIAHSIRNWVATTYVRVVLQVIVENGLVIPIRVPEVTIETGLEYSTALENLKMTLYSFYRYTDSETVIELNGVIEPLHQEAPVLCIAERCVSTVAVLGPGPKMLPGGGGYLLRQAAKSVVWTGFASRCLVGVHQTQVFVDTFGTSLVPDEEILHLLHTKFNFQAVSDENMIEAMEKDIDINLQAVDLDPRVSSFTRCTMRRSVKTSADFYPIHQDQYKNCDVQPIIKALRDGWCFLKEGTSSLKPLKQFVGSVYRHPVSPIRQVPDHILKPEWAFEGKVDEELQAMSQECIEVKTPEELVNMRKACDIARAALSAAAAIVQPGITTDAIDEVIHNVVISHGAYPSWLRLCNGGFSKSCCTSVNEVLYAGVPDARPLKEGDIVSVYVAAFVHGVHGAVMETFCAGEVDKLSEQLIKCSRECLDKVITEVKPTVRCRGVGGVAYPELGVLTTKHAAAFGFKPSKALHYAGIGKRLHSAPCISQYCPGKLKGTMREWLQPGHTFFLEPLIISGECQTFHAWKSTLVSKDGKRSASCGKTVLVTSSGLEVL